MVLILNGVMQDECPMDTTSLFIQHPMYRDYANHLISIPAKTIGPLGLLYVGQRELAAVAPHDKSVTIIGSDDATTCIIVVLRHSGNFLLNLTQKKWLNKLKIFWVIGSGAVALSHLDGTGTDEAVITMVGRVQGLAVQLGYPEGRIELQLIGGFRDPQGVGEELFYNIMRKFF